MSDIENHYGGSIAALVGKDSIAIINDWRLGSGFITTSKSFERIYEIAPRIYIGLAAFVPDCQFLLKKIKKHVKLFRLDENREIEPEELANMVSYILYSYRASPLYTSPIIAGLDSKNRPYICKMDCIGCKTEPGTFVATGTAEKNLVGMCETLYRDGLNESELFTVAGQAFLNSIDRDALSGWGSTCVIITPTKKIIRSLKARCD